MKDSDRRDWIDTGDFTVQPAAPPAPMGHASPNAKEEVIDALTGSELLVLALVANNEAMTVKELSERAEAKPVAVRHSLDRLVDAGLAEGEQVPMGPAIWRLTKQGRAFVIQQGIV